MESGDFNYLNFIKFQHAWVLSSLKIDKKFRNIRKVKTLEDVWNALKLIKRLNEEVERCQ